LLLPRGSASSPALLVASLCRTPGSATTPRTTHHALDVARGSMGHAAPPPHATARHEPTPHALDVRRGTHPGTTTSSRRFATPRTCTCRRRCLTCLARTSLRGFPLALALAQALSPPRLAAFPCDATGRRAPGHALDVGGGGGAAAVAQLSSAGGLQCLCLCACTGCSRRLHTSPRGAGACVFLHGGGGVAPHVVPHAVHVAVLEAHHGLDLHRRGVPPALHGASQALAAQALTSTARRGLDAACGGVLFAPALELAHAPPTARALRHPRDVRGGGAALRGRNACRTHPRTALDAPGGGGVVPEAADTLSGKPTASSGLDGGGGVVGASLAQGADVLDGEVAAGLGLDGEGGGGSKGHPCTACCDGGTHDVACLFSSDLRQETAKGRGDRGQRGKGEGVRDRKTERQGVFVWHEKGGTW